MTYRELGRITPLPEDFNYHLRGRSPEEIEAEVSDMMVGLGYIVAMAPVCLAIGALLRNWCG